MFLMLCEHAPLAQACQLPICAKVTNHNGMDRMLNLLASTYLSQPLAMLPAYVDGAIFALGHRAGIDATGIVPDDAVMEASVLMAEGEGGETYTKDGVRVISLLGSLSNRNMAMTAASAGASYKGKAAELDAAAADPNVSAIAIVINSPGGVVAGIDTMIEAMDAAKSAKPVFAVVDGMAASAAYWIASRATKIFASEHSNIGSIGAMIVHVDSTEANAKDGLKPTIFRAGARKAESNPVEPLSDTAAQAMQSSVDSARAAFAASVAEGRGIPLDKVMGTEAAMFSAAEALSIGLIDEIVSAKQALASIARSPAQRSATSIQAKGNTMDEQKLRAEGATAERARVKAILTHAEADGRGDLAAYLAFDTDNDVEAAIGTLSHSPKAAGAPVAEPAGASEQAAAQAAELAEAKAALADAEAERLAAIEGTAANVAPNPGEVIELSADEKRAEEVRAAMREVTGHRPAK